MNEIIFNKNNPMESSRELKELKSNEDLTLRVWDGFNSKETAFFSEIGDHLKEKEPPKFG